MKKDLGLQLVVNISKQGTRFVAYSPALDISTSGTTKKNVQKNFEEVINVFLEELHEAGTLDTVLKEPTLSGDLRELA